MDIPEQKPTKKTDNPELPAQKPAQKKKDSAPVKDTAQEKNKKKTATKKAPSKEQQEKAAARKQKALEKEQKKEKSKAAIMAASENFYGEKPIFIDDIQGVEEHSLNPSGLSKKQKIFVFSVATFLIGLCSFAILQNIHMSKLVQPVTIRAEDYANLGIYDPSVTYDTKQKALWMAYSAINKSMDPKRAGVPDISIHMANSFDKGKKWSYSHNLFTSKQDELIQPDGSLSNKSGMWRYESASLVYDESDEKKPWKVYAYKYFWTGDIAEARKYSAIVYKEAETLNMNTWSDEKWLFTAHRGLLPSPYSSLIQTHLNELHPSLKDVKYYGEIGALAASNGVLLMTLTAFNETSHPEKIILIGSLDKGKSWNYLGTPITSDDAKHFGDFTRVNGSSLVEQNKRLYLMVSLGNKKTEHFGTHIFPFANAPKGLLKRDEDNVPVPVKVIKPIDSNLLGTYGGGQSTYHPELRNAGILMPQMMMDGSTSPFRVYKTRKTILGDDQ